MAAIGTVVDGKYEILKLVGKGGMSKVYLAMDKRLNKQWAVKEIEKKARDKNNAVVIQSAIAEANMIKRLDHPTLPRIVDIIDNGNVIYIVMDYIEGEALSKVLEREGAQPQAQVIEWAKDLCEVLDYLHTREPAIIYRDMKPANVMLKPDGSLKLIDFGIAREYKDQNIEDTVSLGTKGYAAPEQFGGKGQTDARTDIYCLGVTLYHLVTGQNPCEPPYELYPIRHWDPTLSAGLEAIIQKCTQLNPADRYQSCAELMYALDHYREEDEAYINEQKAKLKKFIISVSSVLVCLMIGCIFLIINAGNDNKNYKDLINAAESAQTFFVDESVDVQSSKNRGIINYYIDAINIKPENLNDVSESGDNPYFSVIEQCRKNADTADMDDLEYAVSFVCNSIKDHKDDINTSKYSELSYKIAEYYLYFAPIIDNKKITLAQPWIYEATLNENAYQDTAILMSNIISFNNNVNEWVNHDDNVAFETAMDSFEASISAAYKSSDNGMKYDIYRTALFVLQQENVVVYLHEKNYSSDSVLSMVALDDISGLSQEKQNDLIQLKSSLQKQLGKV